MCVRADLHALTMTLLFSGSVTGRTPGQSSLVNKSTCKAIMLLARITSKLCLKLFSSSRHFSWYHHLTILSQVFARILCLQNLSPCIQDVFEININISIQKGSVTTYHSHWSVQNYIDGKANQICVYILWNLA